MEEKTTIQITEDLRKKLKVLSSYSDLSYNKMIENLVSVFELSIPFRSELEFAKWFEDNYKKFGFEKIVEKGKGTNYTIIDELGKKKNVELELIGSDFESHGHDAKKIDLIICLYSKKNKVKGIPVLSIVDSQIKEIVEKGPSRHTSVQIPTSLFEKTEQTIKKTGFTSVSDYVTFLLRSIIMDKKKKGEAWAKGDKEKIMKRLKALGYLE